MPGSKTQKNIRLSLEVTPEMYELIESLTTSIGAGSKSEVLRRAIMMMRAANEARRKGKHVGIASSSEDLETEFIGI